MSSRIRQTGVTLIELMIVVTIIGIIAAIAWPSYRKHTLKANRQNGTACLVEVQKLIENYNSRYTGYPTFDATGLSAAGSSGNCPAAPDGTVLYNLTLAPNATVCATFCYQITAAGIGRQARDGSLVLSVDPRSSAASADAYHKQHITPAGTTLEGWIFPPGR